MFEKYPNLIYTYIQIDEKNLKLTLWWIGWINLYTEYIIIVTNDTESWVNDYIYPRGDTRTYV